MKTKGYKFFLLFVSILGLMVLYYFIIIHKYVWFCDEWFSFFITNAKSINIPVDNNRWITATEFAGFTQAHSGFNYKEAIETTATDVHPPMYYLLLKTVCVLFPNIGMNLQGFLANMIVFVPAFCGIVFLIKKVCGKYLWALMGACLIVLNIGVIGCIFLYRMYWLMTAFLILFTIIVYELITAPSVKWYVLLCLDVFMGFMTHYYFCVYVIIFSVLYCCLLATKRRWKDILLYGISTFASVVMSTLFYKAWYWHMFRGYRGEQSIDQILDFGDLFGDIKNAFIIPGRYLFGKYYILFWFVCIVLTVIGIRYICLYRETGEHSNSYILLLMSNFSAVFTYMAISHAMPSGEGRYFWSFAVLHLIVLVAMLLLTVKCFAENDFSIISKLNISRNNVNTVVLTTMLVLLFANIINTASHYSSIPYLSSETLITREELREYETTPWVYYGGKDWKFACSLYDWFVPQKMMFCFSGDVAEIQKAIDECESFVLYLNADSADAVIDTIKEAYDDDLTFDYITDRSYCSVYIVRTIEN